MKINNIQTIIPKKLKRTAKIFVISFVSMIPVQCGKDQFIKEFSTIMTPVVQKSETKIPSSIVEGLKIEKNLNARGGITHCYTDSSLAVLKERLKASGRKTDYACPIDSALKPYIPSTGQFGSVRPGGRVHLGVDIYPRLYGRKPKKPVSVLSVSDGVVVSVKKSPDKDPKNLIANNIKIMSPDGKIYSYDHLGKPDDYIGAKYTPLKDPGTVVCKGDTIGTVGKTGETDVWHLHFSVEDLDVKALQQKNETWKKLNKKHSVYAVPRGQVDPLDKERAGKISEFLWKYRVDNGEKVSYLDKL